MTPPSPPPVASIDGEYIGFGHRFCTGGMASGEMCRWRIVDVRDDFRYGSGATIRNANRGA
ncbi:hypothetical protein AB0B50_29020 [Streptomyces sp. NPDC041068]|uniref:hypothetical protein n=1 Tax=Streptomyces sp. NPDC041068 TaxID=3155130 RepID=UPI003409DC08